MNNVLEIKNATIGYDNDLLHNFDLNIREGEVVALIGPSGRGKSTLIREIIHRSKVTKRFDKFELCGAEEIPRIGYLPQGSHLFPWTTAFNNIAFGRVDVQENDGAQDVLDIANNLGLNCELLNRCPSELSGGEKQRVALARAMLESADLFILDEPFSELDYRLRYDCYSLVKKKIETRGAVLLITHDLMEAVLMSDRIVIIGLDESSSSQEVTVNIAHPRKYHELMTSTEVTTILKKIQDAFDI